jgi:lysophospholipase L1-like esterase
LRRKIKNNDMKIMCIFGDSIVLGLGREEEEGLAALLSKSMEEKNKETKVINLSKDGETTTTLLAHIGVDVEEHKPEEVIIAIGLNDSAYSFFEHRAVISREQFEKNIVDILFLAQKYAKKITVIGILRTDERHTTFSDDRNVVYQYQNTAIQKYNDSLRGISLTHGVTFIDVYSLLSDEELDDGYHPNTLGHRKLYEEIRKHF